MKKKNFVEALLQHKCLFICKSKMFQCPIRHRYLEKSDNNSQQFSTIQIAQK